MQAPPPLVFRLLDKPLRASFARWPGVTRRVMLVIGFLRWLPRISLALLLYVLAVFVIFTPLIAAGLVVAAISFLVFYLPARRALKANAEIAAAIDRRAAGSKTLNN